MTGAVQDLVVVAPFLNLGSTRWWEFKDVSTGQTSRWECQSPAPDRFQLRARLGNLLIEHVVQSKDVDQDGTQLQQFTILQSRIDDKSVTWEGGLVMPAPWKVGASVSATSKEAANPATGNPIKLAVILTRTGPFKPPAGTPFPPGQPLHVIELTQVVTDTGLGTVLAKSDQVFALGLGICSAKGSNFGVSYKLEFQGWSGGN
jgi:hypothetical protein